MEEKKVTFFVSKNNYLVAITEFGERYWYRLRQRLLICV